MAKVTEGGLPTSPALCRVKQTDSLPRASVVYVSTGLWAPKAWTKKEMQMEM